MLGEGGLAMRRTDACQSARRESPAGLSLVEVLVVLAVIGLLLGLVVPALQGAREAARRVECVNHLKQIGLALSSYAAREHVFPPIGLANRADPLSPIGALFSPLVRILPELEQATLFHSTNYELLPSIDGLLANQTVMTVTLAAMLCPSEPSSPVPGYGRTNYRFTYGPGAWLTPFAEREGVRDGPFVMGQSFGPPDFRDGLTNTVGASERLQGDWADGSLGHGDYRLTGVGTSAGYLSIEWAVSTCAEASNTAPVESRGGESWFLSGYHFTGYNHALPPNPRAVDCSFYSWSEGLHWRTLHEGIFPARSGHPGGVNTLRMDGSVHYAGDGIAPTVWRALATRSGAELISLQSE
jgi:prepilin-type N-terminal cleavage/methylation domain-containing protein